MGEQAGRSTKSRIKIKSLKTRGGSNRISACACKNARVKLRAGLSASHRSRRRPKTHRVEGCEEENLTERHEEG